MRVVYTKRAKQQYQSYTNPKLVQRINDLIEDIKRDPFKGIGKPEPLRFGLSGYWSRKIDRANRLVYRVTGDVIEIIACRTHYGER